MQRRLDYHAFCTSVKCAAVVYTFGGKFRQPPDGDSITHEIYADGSEDIRYHFFGSPDQGLVISDLISAYSILTRGVPRGFVPKPEAMAIVNDKDHPIHACFRALNERDRLHEAYFKAARTGDFSGAIYRDDEYKTLNTKQAASLCALGHKEKYVVFDGQKAYYCFENSVDVVAIASAYDAAWDKLVFPQDHPLYWMKSALDHRDEILLLKRDFIKSDGTRGVEPFYVEQRGGEEHLRVTKTPMHILPANLEKSKKYLNS